MSVDDIKQYLPEGIRDRIDMPIYEKVCEMLDYVITNANEEFKDIKYKLSGPDAVSDEVIIEVINELGFSYITDIIDTLTGIEFNILLNFVSLLHLLKGHRDGLELILNILGFDFEITENWEASPKFAPYTFDISIFMNTTVVTDVLATLERLKTFAEHYVYPRFRITTLVFDFDLAEKNTLMAGVITQEFNGVIQGSV